MWMRGARQRHAHTFQASPHIAFGDLIVVEETATTNTADAPYTSPDQSPHRAVGELDAHLTLVVPVALEVAHHAVFGLGSHEAHAAQYSMRLQFMRTLTLGCSNGSSAQ